jgi:hypothetical protein
VFDFDETIAKVSLDKDKLINYDDHVDFLTKDKNIRVYLFYFIIYIDLC